MEDASRIARNEATHVLRLEICMNDLTFSMKEIQTQQDLLRDLLDERKRKAAAEVMPLDETEQRLSQHLEDHADVNPIRTRMSEGVEELNDVVATRMSERRRRSRRGFRCCCCCC